MKKTTASQTHFGFTNIGSEMHSFTGTAIWNNGFWFGSPCTMNSLCKLLFFIILCLFTVGLFRSCQCSSHFTTRKLHEDFQTWWYLLSEWIIEKVIFRIEVENSKDYKLCICRWWNVSLWEDFFREFLNIGQEFPDITLTRLRFEESFYEKVRGNGGANFITAVSELNKLMK